MCCKWNICNAFCKISRFNILINHYDRSLFFTARWLFYWDVHVKASLTSLYLLTHTHTHTPHTHTHTHTHTSANSSISQQILLCSVYWQFFSSACSLADDFRVWVSVLSIYFPQVFRPLSCEDFSLGLLFSFNIIRLCCIALSLQCAKGRRLSHRLALHRKTALSYSEMSSLQTLQLLLWVVYC